MFIAAPSYTLIRPSRPFAEFTGALTTYFQLDVGGGR
jgi:hypothetical protein